MELWGWPCIYEGRRAALEVAVPLCRWPWSSGVGREAVKSQLRWPCSSGGGRVSLEVAAELWSWPCSCECRRGGGRAALELAVVR